MTYIKPADAAFLKQAIKDQIAPLLERIEKLEAGQPQIPQEPTREQLLSVMEAAYGLCHGYDWNCGTAAIAAGYRRKLLSAVNAIKEVPDFEGKYKDASPHTRPHREAP